MFDRYGRMVHRRARLLLILSGIAFVLAAIVGVGAFDKLKNGGFDDPAASSIQAQKIIDEKFGGETNLIFLVHAQVGTVDDPTVRATATGLAHDLAADSDVKRVVSYWDTDAPELKSTDGADAIIAVHVIGDDTQLIGRTSRLIDTFGVNRDNITVTTGGETAINVDLRREVGESLAIAESIAVPVTMVLLILAFGSLVSAMLPLAIGGIAIVGTFAELAVLGTLTDVSVFTINLTTAMGLGLAIDYALLLVSRFREQLHRGATVEEAVVTTVATAGRTIIFSAAAVAAALSSLLVFPQFFLRSFAYAGIGVVAIAALAAIVVVPALLAVLGPKVDKGRLFARRGRAAHGPESPFWGRLASAVMRRPVLAALPVVAALLLAASPLTGIEFASPDQKVLPTTADSRVVADTVRDSFPSGRTSVVDIVADGQPDPGAWGRYAATVSQVSSVARVDTATGSFVDGVAVPNSATAASAALASVTNARLRVITTVEPRSDAAQALARDIRSVAEPSGVDTLVGGADARLVDSLDAIGSRLPYALGLIVASTFVLLFLFTGSVVQPLRAVVLNALSISAALGAMTWIFQDGHLASVLGFTPRPMETSMTVLLFCITFGLSMDYELFLTSRIKELHDRGESIEVAVSTGLARSGRIVSTAAGLLAVSFVAFATSSVSFLQMFGLGSGLAILIDATLIRGVLVPASMKVLSRVVWWAPRPLRWVHARVALKEA